MKLCFFAALSAILASVATAQDSSGYAAGLLQALQGAK